MTQKCHPRTPALHCAVSACHVAGGLEVDGLRLKSSLRLAFGCFGHLLLAEDLGEEPKSPRFHEISLVKTQASKVSSRRRSAEAIRSRRSSW